MSGFSHGNRTAGLLAGAALTFCLTACDGLFDTSRDLRETARVQVSGTSPVPLLLMTSDQFVYEQDPMTGQISVQFVTADTLTIEQLPADKTYSLGQFNRLYVRLINPDSTVTANVRMIIRLDDEQEVYNVQANITGAYIEYTYIVY